MPRASPYPKTIGSTHITKLGLNLPPTMPFKAACRAAAPCATPSFPDFPEKAEFVHRSKAEHSATTAGEREGQQVSPSPYSLSHMLSVLLVPSPRAVHATTVRSCPKHCGDAVLQWDVLQPLLQGDTLIHQHFWGQLCTPSNISLHPPTKHLEREHILGTFPARSCLDVSDAARSSFFFSARASLLLLGAGDSCQDPSFLSPSLALVFLSAA